jgi:hypothetical protein
VILRIEGVDLPGRTCGEHDDVHVGVQRKQEVVDVVPGDATRATWTVEVTTKVGTDGGLDFGGPFVHGKRGERFVYLSWSEGTGGMFRRAKLMLAEAPVADAVTARIVMTDACGMPICARLRDVRWSTGAG